MPHYSFIVHSSSPFHVSKGDGSICNVGGSSVETFEVPMAAVVKQSHDLPSGVTQFSSSMDGQKVVAFGGERSSRVVMFHNGAETASWEQPVRQAELVSNDEQLLLFQTNLDLCIATPNGRKILPGVKYYAVSPSQTKIAYLKFNDAHVYVFDLLKPLDSYSEESCLFVELPKAVSTNVEIQLSNEGDVVAVRHLVQKGSGNYERAKLV